MNKDIIWLKIYTNGYYNLFLKLNDIGITILDNKKYKDYILIKTSYKDYERIKKYLISYKIEIYDSAGYLKIKDIVKKYRIFIMGLFLGFIILLITNNLILKVEIKSPNKNIQNLLKSELKNYGLSPLRFKKNHNKIEKIVENILDSNKELLEWLEIKYDGLVMIVNVTEKTINEENKTYDNCDIVARTDAKIASLNIYRGVALKEINDYVLKDEVILSGSITFNDEVKNSVCASGEVYGEVWYKVKVTVPFKETKVKYTGKNRYNLKLKINDDEYQIFRSRIQNKKEKKINLYKLNDFEINLIKEREYVEEDIILSEEEAYNKALSIAEEKIKLKLRDNEEILVKKVLKKQVNDSTIYLEIFIVTKENIGVVKVVEGVNPNDTQSDPESIR